MLFPTVHFGTTNGSKKIFVRNSDLKLPVVVRRGEPQPSATIPGIEKVLIKATVAFLGRVYNRLHTPTRTPIRTPSESSLFAFLVVEQILKVYHLYTEALMGRLVGLT